MLLLEQKFGHNFVLWVTPKFSSKMSLILVGFIFVSGSGTTCKESPTKISVNVLSLVYFVSKEHRVIKS